MALVLLTETLMACYVIRIKPDNSSRTETRKTRTKNDKDRYVRRKKYCAPALSCWESRNTRKTGSDT